MEKSTVDYDSYIHSAQWQDKRKQRLAIDDFKCQMCGNKDNLEVHHVTYDRLGNENMDDIITLCDKCHTKVHSAQSLAWCFKHHRYPNKGIEKWVTGKEKRNKSRKKTTNRKSSPHEKPWYMVHKRKGKHDVTIFNNGRKAYSFAEHDDSIVETFRNDTLAIGTAIQRGYKYKVVKSYRQDDYTDGGKAKFVRVYDGRKEVQRYNNDGNAVYRVRKQNKGMEKRRKGSNGK